MLYRCTVFLVFAYAVAAAPHASSQPTEEFLGVEPGFLIPMVGTPIPEGFPDRQNCGKLPDTGMSGFFDPMNTDRMLQGDGKILNGTQGLELVTKGCKTMLPHGPKKFTRKLGENGISAAKCIKSDPGDLKPGTGLKHVTSGLKYSVYVAHPMRANVTVEVSREKCEEQLKQVLTECAYRASGGWVLEKRGNKEWLYYGLRVTECDGELAIGN